MASSCWLAIQPGNQGTAYLPSAQSLKSGKLVFANLLAYTGEDDPTTRVGETWTSLISVTAAKHALRGLVWNDPQVDLELYSETRPPLHD
jgi:hypothetical protein